jgi:hypothetical protein
MQQKPKHLAPPYGAQFKDQSVVNAYRNRPAYPDAVFDILISLMPASSQRVLDVGYGTGYLARPFAISSPPAAQTTYGNSGQRTSYLGHPPTNITTCRDAPLERLGVFEHEHVEIFRHYTQRTYDLQPHQHGKVQPSFIAAAAAI